MSADAGGIFNFFDSLHPASGEGQTEGLLMEQNRQGQAPRKPAGTPRRTTYRKREQPHAAHRQPQAGGRRPPRRRPTRKQMLLRAALGVGAVALLALLAAAIAAIFNRGQTAPLEIDPGISAGSWELNDAGYYFNDAGEPLLAATKKGIDVSHHQGEMNWETAQAAGIDFALIRCGFGSEWNGTGDYAQDDAQWRRNADECTRLGIPFGVYLYSYATTEEQARSEADHVARLLGLVAAPYEGLDDYTDSPYQLSYPVYYDLEDKAITGLYPEEMAHLTEVFFDRLRELGYTGEEGVYASLNWTRGRLTDAAFDRWRDNLWIARYSSTLDYTGAYAIWQPSCTESGARYGAQSEDIDIDFVMEELTLTGIEETEQDGVNPAFTNDTSKNELWLPKAKAKATLTTNVLPESEGGQKIFWSSDNKEIATVDKNGTVKARREGTCTITAALADGRRSAEVTVRVGAFTVPVYVTGCLGGETGNGEISLADIAALKAGNADAILVDAGGSLQGSVRASLTGGMDMTSAFADAGYDLHAFDASDLAYGTERLLNDIMTSSGVSIASSLYTAENEALLARSTSWSRNRISNGMNCIVQEAGKRIGFFSLASTGNTAQADELTAADLALCASEQAAALQAKGADAIVCIVGPDTDISAIRSELAGLGISAVLDASATENSTARESGVTTVAAGNGWNSVGQLELTFGADGSLTAAASSVTPAELKTARGSYTAAQQAAYDSTFADLQNLAEGDDAVRGQTLFTLAENETAEKTISFGNYVASFYLSCADSDRGSWSEEAGDLTVTALAGGISELEIGDVTRGTLCDAVPAGERLVLVRTASAAIGALIDTGTVTRTYEEGLTAYEATDGDALLITDTATLAALTAAGGSYEILRDYGDVFWDIRMNLNDVTNNFAEPFTLPEAPQRGAGRK